MNSEDGQGEDFGQLASRALKLTMVVVFELGI
jgi:hypothetical protein